MFFRTATEQWEILMVALILGAAHVFAPTALARRKHPEQWEAFGNGLSAAYVFLHLLPNLDTAHAVLGNRVYFITLLGFLTFYGIELRYQPPKHQHPTKYNAYLSAFFLYDGLLVFTLGSNLPSTPLMTFVFAGALAIDALDTDLSLYGTFGSRFFRGGRWILLGAIAFGYVLSLVRQPRRLEVDILAAALAGFMIFQSFVGLFPVSRTKSFWSFVLGGTVFLGFHVLLGQLD